MADYRLATAAYGQVMDIAWRPRARLAPAKSLSADLVLAVGLVFAFSEPGLDPYHHDGGTLWAAIGVIGPAALAWRRTSPRIVWLIATVVSTWLLVTRRGPDWGGLSPLVLIPAPLVALHGVTSYGLTSQADRLRGQVAAALTLIALEAGLLSHPARPEAVVTIAALVVGAWAAGAGASARIRALEAERTARDLRAATEERARIARELHDILAHHVSVISLQAGTARLLAESGAPAEVGLLAGIETASRQAMTELRHALGVIRHTPGGAEPPSGLARLPELARASGLAVALDEKPGETAGPLPGAVDLTAYRIIQESLTNVLRHSAARSARVTIKRHAGALRIAVTDDGPTRAAIREPGAGRGLAGLRERVAALGGTFRAAPLAAGFEVSATLPVEEIGQ
ncbi:MAG: sensor histidine kinase [Streptosporangiaceae bacterium]|nr:sensor histidine kinase [Streptosporangiaceae bacterium]